MHEQLGKGLVILLSHTPNHNNPMNTNNNEQSNRANRFSQRPNKTYFQGTQQSNHGIGSNPQPNKRNMFQRSNVKNFGGRSTDSKKLSSMKPTSSSSALSGNVTQFQEELQFDSLIGGFPINTSLFQQQQLNHDQPVRALPKFLVYQSPNLKAPPLERDEWDEANQNKMLEIEQNTAELALLYDDFCKLRDIERTTMESKGLVDKEDSRKTLEDAISFTGSCYDMCPVFERIRRSTENDVTRYEKDPITGRILQAKAIKAFSRPAAGQPPPLPSDVRPPQILVQTLDYIIENLLNELPEAQPFIWDRTRSIRQDFTYQNYIGPEAVECTEKIVRLHILTLHVMAKSDVEYSQQQELEQMNKAFKTLSEMYNEFRSRGISAPNEAEFKSYYLLSQLRDPELDREIQALPSELLAHPMVQLALNLRNLVQTNIVQRGYTDLENTLNGYKLFFQCLREHKIPPLFAFLLEIHLNEIRFYAFRALKKSLGRNAKPYPVEYIASLLAFNGEDDLREFTDYYGITVTGDGIDLLSLQQTSHLIPDQKPLKQGFVLKYEGSFGSYQELVNSGESNLDIDVGVIPEFKAKTSTGLSLNETGSGLLGSTTTATANNNIGGLFGQVASNGSGFGAQTSAFGKPSTTPLPSFSFGATPSAASSAATEQAPTAPTGSGFSFGSKPANPQTSTAEEEEKRQQEQALLLLKQQEEEKRKKAEADEQLRIETERKKKQQEEELQRQQQEASRLQEMKQKLLLEKQKRKSKIQEMVNELSVSVCQSMLQSIVAQQTQSVLQPIMAKRQMKEHLAETYSVGLLDAFIGELVYINTLEVVAERFRQQRLQRLIISRVKLTADSLVAKEELRKRKRDEFLQVSKNFGIPSSLIKRKKSNMKLNRGKESQISLQSFKLGELMGKLHAGVEHSLLVYNTNQLDPTIERLLKLKLPQQLQHLSITMIDKKVDDLRMLVDNQFVLINIEQFGTTDEFNLHYLIQGLKLNSNYKVEILIVIWDVKDQANESSIRTTVMKLFRDYLDELIIAFNIIKINSNLNIDSIEHELNSFTGEVQLTKKGQFNVSNKIDPIPSQSQVLRRSIMKASQLPRIIDHPNLLDSTKKLQTKLHNERIFNHYRTHLEASPAAKYKKLPTLRSTVYKDSPVGKPSSTSSVMASSSAFKQPASVQKHLRIEETTHQSSKKQQGKLEMFHTPRPKSSQLLQTPSFFNDSSATMSTFSNVTFDGQNPNHITPLIRKQEQNLENHQGDVRMTDVEPVGNNSSTAATVEPPLVDHEEYSRNLNELKELTKLVRKNHFDGR
ncbi:hypothetical protein WICPIJ_006030 [Wickerhamomyces pijperi]|uniref:Nuclear mRNA export factor n=1 Tax=Wickerhamomyces pijperi TaxID=599730 RepID=A0A9P8Q4H7_WICPI|nr:hypothetical protein WICPIJ_006030 [Wickerhamomyces pijperi]